MSIRPWNDGPSYRGNAAQWAIAAELLSEIMLDNQLQTKDALLLVTDKELRMLIARARKSIYIYSQIMVWTMLPEYIHQKWLADAREFLGGSKEPVMDWEVCLHDLSTLIAQLRLCSNDRRID